MPQSRSNKKPPRNDDLISPLRRRSAKCRRRLEGLALKNPGAWSAAFNVGGSPIATVQGRFGKSSIGQLQSSRAATPLPNHKEKVYISFSCQRGGAERWRERAASMFVADETPVLKAADRLNPHLERAE